jgi:O-antigen ligase
LTGFSVTDFDRASQIAPIRTFRAADVRFGERRAEGEGKGGGEGKGRAGSYWLLLVFVSLLYLNLPVLWPALELIHPAKIVAGLALITLLGETMLGRGTFDFGWPEGGLLIGFLGIAALSCMTALWPGHAVAAVSDLSKMVLVFFLIVNAATTVRRLRGLMWTMAIGGLIPAVSVLRNYWQGQIVEGRTAWVGIFANPNDLAYSLVILVPIVAFLAVELGWLGRLVVVGMSLVYMAGVYVTFSRGCLIGLVAVIALIAWKQRSMVLKALIIVAIGAAMMFASRFWSRNEDFKNISEDDSFQERIATSQAGLSMFLDHPLLGVGPACSVVAWPLYAPQGLYTRGALVTHNTFIQALSETGALGFVAFMAFVGLGVYHATKLAGHPSRPNLACVGSGLAIAMVGFFVCGLSNGNVLTWFPYILVGMVTAARRIEGEN